jgi:hypothetical protein
MMNAIGRSSAFSVAPFIHMMNYVGRFSAFPAKIPESLSGLSDIGEAHPLPTACTCGVLGSSSDFSTS